jgi:hypothetical protein
MPLFHNQATLDNFFKETEKIGKELIAEKEKFKNDSKIL